MEQIISNISEANTLAITSGIERALDGRILKAIKESRTAVVKKTYGPSPIAEDAADGGGAAADNDSDTDDDDEENMGMPDDADEECVNLILAMTGLDPEQKKKKKGVAGGESNS